MEGFVENFFDMKKEATVKKDRLKLEDILYVYTHFTGNDCGKHAFKATQVGTDRPQCPHRRL